MPIPEKTPDPVPDPPKLELPDPPDPPKPPDPPDPPANDPPPPPTPVKEDASLGEIRDTLNGVVEHLQKALPIAVPDEPGDIFEPDETPAAQPWMFRG